MKNYSDNITEAQSMEDTNDWLDSDDIEKYSSLHARLDYALFLASKIDPRNRNVNKVYKKLLLVCGFTKVHGEYKCPEIVHHLYRTRVIKDIKDADRLLNKICMRVSRSSQTFTHTDAEFIVGLRIALRHYRSAL